MGFDWKEFENMKIAAFFTCESEYRVFLENCELRGYRWASGCTPTRGLSYIHGYGYVVLMLDGAMRYSGTAYAAKRGYKLTRYKQL